MSLDDIDEVPDCVITSLLDQGVNLGFFHSRSSISLEVEKDDLKTYRQSQRDGPMRHSLDKDCQLMFFQKTGNYHNREGLIDEIVDELDSLGGRASKRHIYQTMKIEPMLLEPGSPLLELLPKSSVQAMGTYIISEHFWANLRREASREVHEKGVVDVLKFVNKKGVEMEAFLTMVVSKLECVTFIEGSQELASIEYVEKLRHSLVQHFQSLKEPMMVAEVCVEHSCNFRLALGWLTEEIRNEEIKGEIHLDNQSQAMFIPSAYTDLQQEEVTKIIEGNGFITKARASRHGLSLFKIQELAKENHEDVLLLDDVLIVEHIALRNVEAAVHLCMEIGVVDLGEYLPASLLRRDILMELLQRANVSSNTEVPVISDGRAILISERFHDEVCATVVLPLIQSFAMTRAEEIIKERTNNKTREWEDETTQSQKRNKSKFRKNKEKHADNRCENGQIVVPLQQIAQKVIDQYPTLPMADTTLEEIDKVGGGLSPDELTWDNEDDSGYLLIEFCKRILYTDCFRAECDSAVRAELSRLESSKMIKMSKARISSKEVAGKLRNVDSAFEDCFTNLCHLIQASSKFFLFASGCNDMFSEMILTEMEKEILLGYCADLTSRITQYCLYKHEEDALFTFRLRGEEGTVEGKTSNSNLPSFCKGVDHIGIQPIRCYLSCPPPRNPLPVLRECLDGNNGVTLARQWILCGGEAFRGGVQVAEEGGETFVRKGSLDGFLVHLQENCLMLCGLPFKRLEKKTEKQLLFRRRMALVTLLEETMDPAKVLDLTIVLLFQQLKHLVVYGKHLRGAILDSLLKERKISGTFCAVILEGLRQKIQNGSPIPQDYLNAVRDCGLSKDIGKHVIDIAMD